ncbi:potassium channel family protein [Sphingomonas sp.]|uniref:potassium channel family protein n=1 Tax=Sphingomonas sp. TaxID=28214 RepID=UPI0035C7A916
MLTPRPARPREPVALRRRSNAPAWVPVAWRLLLAFALIGIALAVHWFDRAGLRDNIDGAISFVDVLYFTMITVTTVGYGDITPVTPQARLFDTFVVTPIRLFVWLIFLGTAYDFLLRRVWDRMRMRLIQQNLLDHVVVAGHGDAGQEAVRELIRRGTPVEQIVVVDQQAAALAPAEEVGAAVMEADATHNATLEAARLDQARAMVVAAGRDDTSILIVLTARRIAPEVPISVVIRAGENESLAQQAGANTVINPASFAGLLLASSTQGRHVADCLADLANIHGQVALCERAVAADEIGRALDTITTGKALRLYRDHQAYGFWDKEAQHLRAGDRIVEVVHPTRGR